MIYHSTKTTIEDSAVTLQFSGSGGPGGQNVNKVATAVQLRLDLSAIEMADAVRQRLRLLAGSRITEGGELLISARTFRTQRENRDEAMKKLIDLIRKAEIEPKKRTRTKPTRASKQKRLDRKKQHSDKKASRRKPLY